MKKKMMADTEIRVRGIEALNQALGPSHALRFLALFHQEPTDYVKISSRLYKGQTVEEIFERGKKFWNEEVKNGSVES